MKTRTAVLKLNISLKKKLKACLSLLFLPLLLTSFKKVVAFLYATLVNTACQLRVGAERERWGVETQKKPIDAARV